MDNIALICVTHDPDGMNIELVKKLNPVLKEIYKDIFITVSQETDKKLIYELEKKAFNIKLIPKEGAAQARREVIKFALTSSNQYFHYCDFDRLLTWVNRYQEELKNTAHEILKHDFLIIGRTERAFNTHPIEWIETEKLTNKIFSLELGQETDVTAGSCRFSRSSGELILEHSKAKMTDAEWPMIVHRIGNKKVDYIAVEGLEYREEVNGHPNQTDSAEKWFSRVKLCYIISESAINTGKTPFLIIPGGNYKKSFETYVLAYKNSAEEHYFNMYKSALENFDEYIKFLDDYSNGINLTNGQVATSTFWLIHNNEVVGVTRVRHEEVECAGHIGYDIAPCYRKKGYGSIILKLALKEAYKLGINKAIVTCGVDNISSKRIIEKNNGQLLGTVFDEEDNENLYKYSIDTSSIEL